MSLATLNFPAMSGRNHPRQFTRTLATAGTSPITAYAAHLSIEVNADYGTLRNFTDAHDFEVGDRLTLLCVDTDATTFDASVKAIGADYVTITPLPQTSKHGIAFNVADNTVLIAGNFTATQITGVPVMVEVESGGTIASPLSSTAMYYLIRDGQNVARLATTRSNAAAGTAINITDAGVGNHRLIFPQIVLDSANYGVTLDAALDTLTTASNMDPSVGTGTPVTVLSADTLAGPLVEGITYYLIRINDTTAKLAENLSDALEAIAIDLDDVGVGDHSLVISDNTTQYHGTCTVTLHLPFNSVTFYGNKAAQTENASDALIGSAAGANAQPQTLAGGSFRGITLPPGATDDLASWYIETASNGDGVTAEIYP